MREFQTEQLTITREKLLRYAELSDDFNPIHVDPVFAAATPMGGIIAHGTLSLSLLMKALERAFGPPVNGAHQMDIKFRRPVREGDTVEAGGSRLDDGQFSVWVRNQRGEIVIDGFARLSTLCTSAHVVDADVHLSHTNSDRVTK